VQCSIQYYAAPLNSNGLNYRENNGMLHSFHRIDYKRRQYVAVAGIRRVDCRLYDVVLTFHHAAAAGIVTLWGRTVGP